MKQRCDFLDILPAFNYNTGSGEFLTNEFGMKMATATDTNKLGSTLMQTMLSEVSDFCDPSIKENWSLKAHQQVCVYLSWFFLDSYKSVLSLIAHL